MPDKATMDARNAARDTVEGARASLKTLLDGLPDSTEETVSGARSTLNFCLNALDAEAADMARIASQEKQAEPVFVPPAPVPIPPAVNNAPTAPTPNAFGAAGG